MSFMLPLLRGFMNSRFDWHARTLLAVVLANGRTRCGIGVPADSKVVESALCVLKKCWPLANPRRSFAASEGSYFMPLLRTGPVFRTKQEHNAVPTPRPEVCSNSQARRCSVIGTAPRGPFSPAFHVILNFSVRCTGLRHARAWPGIH